MYEYNAKMIRTVDGDTIEIEIDLGFEVSIKQIVRLARIDAYETRLGRNTTEEEKVKGIQAKTFVQELLPPETVIRIRTDKETGKYGRYIADVFYNDSKNLNDELVNLGFAVYREY